MEEIQYARAKELIEAELGEEIVALDADGGDCFGFNSVAADIWRMLDRPRDLETLLNLVMDQYEVDAAECEAGLRSCLAELERNGLIRTVQANS